MKYLFLAYSDQQQWETLSANERATFAEACYASDQALRESGYLLTSGELPSSMVVTVWVQQGKLSLTDGSFAGAGKQLVGFFFIEAKDLNEAIQVAAKMPQSQRGPVEIRPTP